MERGSKPLSVVLAGGGTAGHVNPLLAIASAVAAKEPRASMTVVGTKSGLEARLVPRAGYPLETIPKVPFPRKPDLDALAFPGRWISEVRRVERILKDARADVVVGVGGYAAAPAYRAARRMGLPIVIHEQNARAGMANKLGAKWAAFVGTAYGNTDLKVGAKGAMRRVGLPLRPAIASRQPFAMKAPVSLLIVADLSDPVYSGPWNTLSHYDAGIVSGNIYLYCAANSLATVCRGTMDRDALRKALKLPASTAIHLNHPVGYPAK